MRVLIHHHSRYLYPKAAALGPHVVRLRPANHTKARIETYALEIGVPCDLRWQQDPYGNHLARLTFPPDERVNELSISVELAVEIRPVNPFDFFVDERAGNIPFRYPGDLSLDLSRFLDQSDAFLAGGQRLDAFLSELPRSGKTVPLIVELNRLVNRRIRYVIRDEPGIWTPEETLGHGRGSCRDMAVLLIAVLRSRGLAARFSSGYLVQLQDEGMIPDEPKGVTRDVVDLHAWAEVYVPGGGWIGLDPTSGLFAGEGHIPLACTSVPALAAPIDGTTDTLADRVEFEASVGRLGHEPRPTAPYLETTWSEMLEAGARADARLQSLGLTLTMGGEPTFNSREHPSDPEWNGAALGPTKTSQGRRLIERLRERAAPGGVILERMGKHYPGESMPRWALDLWARRDGRPIWSAISEPARAPSRDPVADAKRFASSLASRLELSDALMPAFEDPWRFLQDEASLPVDVDPLRADLSDSEERRRLAHVLDRGLNREVGFVLPLARRNGRWIGERWSFRRGHLFLIQGDSPVGLRLPLRSLSTAPAEVPYEAPLAVPDPRRTPSEVEQKAITRRAESAASGCLPTALCVEPRDGRIFVFLPPLSSAEDFLLLIGELDRVRKQTGLDIALEGYPPPPSSLWFHLSIAPDPGVLEVNLQPTESVRAYVDQLEVVFDAALHAGLHCEKYMLDGRMAGSGGGNHLTLGGPTPLASPFVQRPDLLASLLTFLQHHPSLSYLFTGLFVGPTSQAPRVDEARHDSLDELEIALERAFRDEPAPPWLSDLLFRHLLVDLAGNTHRAEVSIDKLFDWQTAHGRQGLIELRAFEMPPHVRMAAAEMLLLRSLVTAFAQAPYRGKLVRWGTELHDRFLLPYWMWRDFEDVLAFLASRGLALPPEGYRPFIELRCPLAGRLELEGIALEVRNAIEPWHVLGEELTSTGTSRYVDSSMERIEVRASGLTEGRHQILVNGRMLPLRSTGFSGERVAGIRFRAWAPPHSLHAHIGIHHPIRLDVVDRWSRRSIGACAYHVWHPEGQGFEAPPLTRFEASARRAQRFTIEGPMMWPAIEGAEEPPVEATYTLDLRRLPIDRPMPIEAADRSEEPA